jgi:hypothetical protein
MEGISNIEQGISNDEVRFFTSLCSVQNDPAQLRLAKLNVGAGPIEITLRYPTG